MRQMAVLTLWSLLLMIARAAPGDPVPGLSFLEKTIVTGFDLTTSVIGTSTFTVLPGASVDAVCSLLTLDPVSLLYDQNPNVPSNINLNLMYSLLTIPTSKNWISGVCTAFVTDAPFLAACTSSLDVICSQIEPKTAPLTTVITATAISSVAITNTVTVTVPTVTAFSSTLTVYTISSIPSTSTSTTRTTTTITFTTTTFFEQTTITQTSLVSSTLTESFSVITFTTDPFTVTVKVSVALKTDTIISLTDDISSVIVKSTQTITSCPFTTTTDNTETKTSSVPFITGTGTLTVRTKTRTKTRLTTTGTCSLTTVTTIQSSGTVIDVMVDTVTIIVPPPPCPTISPCDREEGCYSCPYEFPCGLKGPLERCGIQDPIFGLVLAVSPAHKDNATCVCENVGVNLKPAVINTANQETAFNIINGCLGSNRYAWIGEWNGVVGESNCLALFVKNLQDLTNQGGAVVPPDCQARLPVLCGPDQ